MTEGPYRDNGDALGAGFDEAERDGRFVAVASSAIGWASAILTVRLCLSTWTRIDAALLLAGAALGAAMALVGPRLRHPAGLSIVAATVGGAALGCLTLSSALASRGLAVEAGLRFALANGCAYGAPAGFLLGVFWAPAARAAQRYAPAVVAGRSDAASLALTWLGVVGGAGGVLSGLTGAREGLAGVVLALSTYSGGATWLLHRDSNRLQRSGGEVPVDGRRRVAIRTSISVLFVACIAVFIASRAMPRARWINAALDTIDSQRAHPGHMVAVHGGTFVMGSPRPLTAGAEDGDEFPPHVVVVASFELDDTEVTVADYRRCVNAKGCSTDGLGDAGFYSKYCNWGDESRANHPINCVTWFQADAYCHWADKRLPTESEWEYAARGGSGQAGHWGDTARPCACDSSRSPDGTCPVGRFPSDASDDLVLDLAGNVWEWTSSPHCYYPERTCTDGARVMRGGGWACSGQPGSPWTRIYDSPRRRDEELGFRCAR